MPESADIPWYHIQKEPADNVLITIGGFLALIGTFWFLYAMGGVLGEARVLSNHENYKQSTAVVTEVCWSDSNIDGPYFFAEITVDGEEERVPLAEFAGIKPGMLIDSGNSWPLSQAQAEQLVPTGTVLKVLYDPARPRGFFMGYSLRVLPYHPDSQQRHRKLALRYTVYGVWPLFTGLSLVIIGFLVRIRRRRKQQKDAEPPAAQIQSEGAPSD